MPHRTSAMDALLAWYIELPRPRSGAGLPAKGSLAVGLVLLERLRTVFDFRLDAHLAPGGAQIQGASGATVRKILARFGESREFVGEGGRTNRGTPTIVEKLLGRLGNSHLANASIDSREQLLTALQQFLVEKVQEFHNLARLKPTFDPAASTRKFISELLILAFESGKRGPVAQYLVGAKLQLRFPDAEVRNENYSAADDPSGQPGDFVVGDTTFHVTVAPSPGHYDKCLRNLREGRRVFLLVPDDFVIGARQNAESTAPGQIAVESIESFVAQNVEELSKFSREGVVSGLRLLLETYNARVNAADIDKSMMIEVPRNLSE